MSLVKLVVRTPKKLSEAVSALLFEAGAGGIEELDGARRLVVYAASRAEAEAIATRTRDLLREIAPGPSGVALAVEVDESSDWASAWTRHLGQVQLTPRCVIQPLWDETAVQPGVQRILFDPKLAFGDGAHATTRLAAAALERSCDSQPNARVLDFGSGTGVLCFVALFAGAASACGVDIDPIAIDAARRNADLNGLNERARFCLPDELQKLQSENFEIAVANIEAPALLSLAGAVQAGAHSAKRLILTGFLQARESEILAAFAPAFRLGERQHEEDWSLLELVSGR